MSQILTESPEHCAKHGMKVDKFYKRLFYALSTIFLSILAIVLLIWFILHPSKPHFYLKQADIYQLNLSGPHFLDSSIQTSFLANNPNQKVGIFYDQLQAYASYNGQQITEHSFIPPFFQGHEDTSTLSASLIGRWVPVTPSFGYEVGRDQVSGNLVLVLKLNGRLRWKVGNWVSGHHRFNVDCAVAMAFPSNGALGPMSSTQGSRCSTSV